MEKENDLNNPEKQINNPLHGVRLADILDYLVKKHGWEYLGDRFNFKCFNQDPSVNSSLKFLRKTDWARKKVEEFYVKSIERERRG